MNGLIVFARAPVVGKVKTRLLKNTPLDEKEVCELYRSFLCDVLETAALCSAEKIILNFDPPDMEKEMLALAENLFPPERLELVPQTGETFSARIEASFRHAAESGMKSAVMIGSDSPTLQSKTIDNAFKMLDQHGGAVLGPSGEGGIYLIGLNRERKPDFEKIFGDSAELMNFALQMKEKGIPLTILEEVTDVDVASDLVSLISLITAMKSAAGNQKIDFPKNSAETIEKLGLNVARRNGTRDKVIVRGG